MLLAVSRIAARPGAMLLLACSVGCRPAPDCEKTALSTAHAFEAEGDRARIRTVCETMQWSEAGRRCVVEAASKEAIEDCFEAIQPFKDAVRILCESPSKARDAGSADADLLPASDAIITDRVINPAVLSELSYDFWNKPDRAEKQAAYEGLAKRAGVSPCPYTELLAEEQAPAPIED